MSDDNHTVSLEMLRAHLAAMESNVEQALQKRRQAARNLRAVLAANSEPLAISILSSLDGLSASDGDFKGGLLQRWAAEFPDDMDLCGLRKVSVSGSEPLRIWDQARAIFGHAVSMSFDADHREALTACIDQPGCVGVLGWMTLAGSGQWWPILNETRYHDLRIVGAWPVKGSDTPYAAIIARGPLGTEAGTSTILMAHDDHHKVSRIFSDLELDVREFGRARSLVLFEVQVRMSENDPRLKAAKLAGLDGLRVVGALPAYPRSGK